MFLECVVTIISVPNTANKPAPMLGTESFHLKELTNGEDPLASRSALPNSKYGSLKSPHIYELKPPCAVLTLEL